MEKRLSLPKHSTIKHKLIVLIGGQFLLYFSLLYALFFQFQNVLGDKISELTHQTVMTVTGNIDIHQNNNVRLSNVIASDSSLIRLLRNHPDFSETSSIWAQVQILEKLKSLTAGSSYVYGVSIYNPESGKLLSTTEGLVNATGQIQAWHKDIENSSEALGVRVDLQGESTAISNKESSIYLLRTLPGKQQNNMLIIHTSKQVLDLMIGEVGLWEGTAIVITDTEGNLIFQTGSKIEYSPSLTFQKSTDQNHSASYANLAIKDVPYIAVDEHSKLTGWNVTMIIPQKEIMQDLRRLKQAAVMIAVLLSLFFVILTYMLYTQILNPIKRLKRAIVSVEKGLPYEAILIHRMDEFGYLQQRFNEMINNEQHMRAQIVKEQLLKKEIELKFLQSQVNPHFLYNTLDSIYWVAVEKDNEEIGDVVLDLSRYFRLSLSRGKEFVSIKETIEHLDYYIRIQQFRYLNKFHIEWKIEHELEELKIMKLMLQPIVENAIIHGLERTVEDCYLSIQIYSSGDEVIFRIQDSGIGIERRRLKQLMQEIKYQEGPSETTYGLHNLYQRLKLMYGEDMRFSIASLPNQGTRVTIRIRSIRLEGGSQHESHNSRG